MGRRLLQRLKAVDFYRKIPNDLTEATLAGAIISISAAVVILLLLGFELGGYLRPGTRADMVVDRSPQGELLIIHFNISFPDLSCEYAALDISDTLGMKRLNVSRTVRKQPISRSLTPVGTGGGGAADGLQREAIAYDGAPPAHDGTDYAKSLDARSLSASLGRYEVVVVNFFAPWCSWCQRLAPTWEAAAAAIQASYPEAEGSIRYAKVDCVAHAALCREHVITAFPSIRIFRHGSDDVVRGGHHEHEGYYGDRTLEALVALAHDLVPATRAAKALPAGGVVPVVKGVERAAAAAGCNFSGSLAVKKVPGTMHFAARAPGQSFDHERQNMSHFVHHLYFGSRPARRDVAKLAALRPGGLPEDWDDRLGGRWFMAPAPGSTFQHYLQVVLTTLQPPRGAPFDAYEYTVQSHGYDASGQASTKLSYTMSPIQIVVRSERRPLYGLFIAVCAVLGGVFTLAGILDGIVHHVHTMAKKVEIGKQG